MTNYQKAKMILKSLSLGVKSEYKSDKPLIRQVLNDTCDELIRDLRLSEYESNLLSNYVCKLHPKN